MVDRVGRNCFDQSGERVIRWLRQEKMNEVELPDGAAPDYNDSRRMWALCIESLAASATGVKKAWCTPHR